MLTGIHRSEKTAAQTMVEFALVLPVLLLVMYGLIEAGRLMFIYASVTTAARQAARYGSATGTNEGGTPFYQDCEGIIAAANRVAFINSLSDVQISYDGGLDGSGNPIPLSGGNDSCVQGSKPSNPQNGWRINIQVTAQYSPIIPFMPFEPLTITTTSSRTLVAGVAIDVPAPPQGWSPSETITLTVNAVSSSPYAPYYAAVGDVITYTYIITNGTSHTLTPPYQIIDDKATGITCQSADIPPGGSITCSGTYTITQADIDNGRVTSIATAIAGGYTSSPVQTDVLAVWFPDITLTKSPSPNVALNVGQVVTYTYTLLNSGNVSLSSPFIVSDNKVANVSCPSGSIAPNASVICSGTYTITSADVAAGAVTNTATATARKPNGDPFTSQQASATVITKPLFLSVSTSPMVVNSINQTIVYTYTLRNAGSSPISSLSVTDTRISVDCSAASDPLMPGQTTTCSGTYVTTQADLDAGVITSQATASGIMDGSPLTSNQVTASVTAAQNPQITLTVAADPTKALTVGTVVSYTYTLTNSGNVTLHSPFSVSDSKVSPVDCSSAPASLAPGASFTCSGTYTITQADIDNGSVIDSATASGKTPSGGTTTSASSGATVITYDAPRLSLEKSANPSVVSQSGETITYTYTLRNTGNTPLTSPFSVSDDKIPGVDCSGAVSPIPIGGSTACTARYIVTSDDITAGSITNHATATAQANGSPLTSNTATKVVPVMVCDPRHSPFPPSPFNFRMTIYNNGSITLTISTIVIYYNSSTPANQWITQLTLGGATIWSGKSGPSPATFNAFSGSVTIPPGGNKILTVYFKKNYTVNNSERITVNFAEAQCASVVLDSSNTASQPGGLP